MIVDLFFTALAIGMLGRAIHRYSTDAEPGRYGQGMIALWSFLTAANCATWIF